MHVGALFEVHTHADEKADADYDEFAQVGHCFDGEDVRQVACCLLYTSDAADE